MPDQRGAGKRRVQLLRTGPTDVVMLDADTAIRWSRTDVQRVLYNIVRKYEQALELGGDSELLRDAIRIGRETLRDNNWWPRDRPTDPGKPRKADG